jgi:LacI family transcriptional regulator
MDNTNIAELANPALTSVDLGSEKRARKAAHLLLARLDDPDRPVQSIVVSPTLVVRESSVVNP